MDAPNPHLARSLAPCAALAAALFSAGCEQAPTAVASASSTSTVSVSRDARVLVIDAVFPVQIFGERRTSEVLVELELSVTASSAEAAEAAAAAAAEGYGPRVERAEGTLTIALPPPEVGLVAGSATFRAPRDLDLRVLSRGGEVDVSGMEGALRVDSARSVRVLGAEEQVVIRVERGNALVDTPLRAGQVVDIGVGSGDVQVDLPTPLDARVDASSTGGVVSQHPDLPARPPSVPYRVTTGSGLASVVATTRGGTVIFRTRRRN